MVTFANRINTLLLLMLILMAGAIITMLATRAYGGSLDPPGAPGSTLQRLSDIPPSWGQVLPSNNGGVGGCNSTRFECVMADTAVLDHETGLVWQRAVAGDATNFINASYFGCETLELDGRYGWHLPTVQQLRSLVDASADHLPDGHPFLGVLTASPHTFWSSSLFNLGTGELDLWVVNVDLPADVLLRPSTELHRRWCVRGGAEWSLRY